MSASIPDDVPTLSDLASLDDDAADELADTNEVPIPAASSEETLEDETIRGAIPEELMPSQPVLVHPKSLMPSSISPVALDLSHGAHDDQEDTATLRTELPRPTTTSPIAIDANVARIPRGRANTGTQRDPLLAIVPHATSHARAYAIAASLAAAAVLAVGAGAILRGRGPEGLAAGAGASPHVADVVAAREVAIDGPVAEKLTAESALRPQGVGTLRFAPSVKGALVDGHPTRIPDGGALVLSCGRHTVKVGGNPHVTLDVPCGGTRTF